MVEDKLGIELPDGKKKPPPKEGRSKPLDVPNFDNAKRTPMRLTRMLRTTKDRAPVKTAIVLA